MVTGKARFGEQAVHGLRDGAASLEKVHELHYKNLSGGVGMPTIIEIGNVKIQIFADDHNPPHFHVVTPDFEAVFRIADFQRLAGHVDRRSLHNALTWARQNRKVLEDEWNRLNP